MADRFARGGLQWTPNGLLLVGAGVDGVGVYDLRNGQRVKHMSVRGEEVCDFAFHPLDTVLAAASRIRRGGEII